MNLKKIVLVLLHSKLGKLLPVLLIAGLTATASATVFVMYYGNATAAVQTPDLTLVAGSDASGSCTKYPCATVSVASTNDFATIGLSLFPSATNTLQPSTYYTNLLQVHNGGLVSHSINSLTISNIAQSGTDLGSITVYLCATSLDVSVSANAATCASFTFTSTSGGSLSAGSTVTIPYTLTSSSNAFVEVVGHAATTAVASDTITFQITFSWV